MTFVALCHDASNERCEELENENKLRRAQLLDSSVLMLCYGSDDRPLHDVIRIFQRAENSLSVGGDRESLPSPRIKPEEKPTESGKLGCSRADPTDY